MRLKLNRTLRAALIAAITAAGFTLSQAQAEQQLTITPTSWTGSHTNISWTEQTGTLNSWKLTFDLTVKNGNANDFFNISSNNNTAQAGWALGTTGTTLQLAVGGKTGSPAVITLSDAFALNTAQTITYQFVRDVDDEGASLGTGTFTVTAGELTSSYKVDSLTDTALVSGNGGRGHIWANGNPGQHQLANITLTQLDDHEVTIPTSTWQGKLESHNWADSVWDTGTYQDGNKAVFGADGYNEVTVSAATTAASVSVSDQEYTFEIEGGGSLAAAKANIADSGSLTVKGTEANAGTVTITSLSGAGDLIVGENGTATVNGLNAYTGTMSVEDGGTLNLGSSIILSDLTVEDGTVTTQHSGGSGVVANTLTIGEDGTFKVIGQHDAFGYGTGTTKDIVMQGAENHIATLSLEQTTGNSVTMNANLQLKGYAHITTTKNGFNTHDGAIYAEGVDNSIDKFQLRHAATIEVKEGGELTVGEMTFGTDGTHNLTKTGAGTLTFTGTANMQALDLQDGSLVVNGGTTTVAGTSTSTLNKTITVTAGELVLIGTFEIGGNTGGMKTTYVGGDVAGNGFESLSGTATVYTKAEEATVNVANAHFTVGGTEATVDENGVYTTEGTVNYGTFYVKSEEESLGKAIGFAGEHTVSTVSLAEGTTINADSAGASIGLALVDGGSATVNATEDTTLSSITGLGAGQTLTVSGSSVVTFQNASDFAGDLAVTGSTVKLGNKTALGAFNTTGDKTITIGEGGTVDINGLADANYTYTLDGGTLTNSGSNVGNTKSQTTGLVVTNDSTIGGAGEMWVLSPSYESNTVELQNNTLTKVGEGVFGFKNTAISEGTLKVDKGTLKFEDASGRSGSIAADIELNGGNIDGTLNMAGDISITTMEDTATNATINVGDHELTLTTEADKTLTLNRSLTIGEGSVNVTGDGTLLVNCTLNLGDKLTGEGNIAVGASGNLTLTGGSTIASVISNSGSVSLTGLYLDTDNFTETQGQDGAHFGLDDQETTGDNYFTGTSADYVLVVDGGTSTGTGLTWGELTDQTLTDGRIITKAAAIDHTTFYVGSEISTSAINASEHAAAIENINVGNGATLTVDAVSEAAIHAGDGATVAGDKAQELVKIAMGETVTYADGLKAADNGSAEFSGDVQVTNAADESTFSVTNQNMVVQADDLTLGEGALARLEIQCGVDVDTITNQSGQELVLRKLVASELTGVSALSGDIALVSTQDELTINNLVIQTGQSVEVLDASLNEITVTVADTLASNKGTLFANLVMEDDSALLVGGVEQALHVGSTLTMGQNIALDGTTLQALDDLAIGEFFWLINAAEGRELTYEGPIGEDAWYDSVFSRIAYDGEHSLQGDFNIVFDDVNGFGLKKFSDTPEPTTGTLSLLALAALAARRRRH